MKKNDGAVEACGEQTIEWDNEDSYSHLNVADISDAILQNVECPDALQRARETTRGSKRPMPFGSHTKKLNTISSTTFQQPPEQAPGAEKTRAWVARKAEYNKVEPVVPLDQLARMLTYQCTAANCLVRTGQSFQKPPTRFLGQNMWLPMELTDTKRGLIRLRESPEASDFQSSPELTSYRSSTPVPIQNIHRRQSVFRQ